MTRTVTLTFDDGSSHIYNNVPDEITPEQVQQRASSEFSGKSLVNIDGGNKKQQYTMLLFSTLSQQKTYPLQMKIDLMLPMK